MVQWNITWWISSDLLPLWTAKHMHMFMKGYIIHENLGTKTRKTTASKFCKKSICRLSPMLCIYRIYVNSWAIIINRSAALAELSPVNLPYKISILDPDWLTQCAKPPFYQFLNMNIKCIAVKPFADSWLYMRHRNIALDERWNLYQG